MSRVEIYNDRVSIQLPLGGHSFSADDISADVIGGTLPVEIILPSRQTMLVPEQEFDTAVAGALLSTAGMPCREGQCAVYTRPLCGMVGIMAVEESLHKTLREVFGERIYYSTPLLSTATLARGVVLQRIDDLLFVRIYDDGLQMAEVMTAANDADVVYLLSTIDREYHIYNTECRIVGESGGLLEICKTIFKHASCE